MNGSKKPKIALMHFSGPPLVAGVELLIKDQARLLVQNNYRVTLVVGTGKQFRKDIPVHIIRRMDSANKFVQQVTEDLERGFVSPLFYKLEKELYDRLKEFIVSNGINICIVHNVMTRHYNLPLTSALAKLSKDFVEVKFIAWTHDLTFSDTQYIPLKSKIFKIGPWKLLRQPLDNWKYVCVSEFRKKELLQAFNKERMHNLSVIPNGLDLEKLFRLSPIMRNFYNMIDGRHADLIACTPVRVVRRKNLELGIRIAKEMIKKGQNFYLLITANIDHHQKSNLLYFQELKKLIANLELENHVFFLSDFINHHASLVSKNFQLDVAEVYKISDFLLMTSTIEGFGLPIIEAGFMKLPIFASNISPFHEIGETNIQYFNLSETPENIAKYILESLKKMPQAYFYRKVIQNYSIQHIFSEKILPLLES